MKRMMTGISAIAIAAATAVPAFSLTDEVDMLEYAWGSAADSRLACQVELDASLSGIVARIPAR